MRYFILIAMGSDTKSMDPPLPLCYVDVIGLMYYLLKMKFYENTSLC